MKKILVALLVLTIGQTFAQSPPDSTFIRNAVALIVPFTEGATLLSDSVFAFGNKKYSYVSGDIRSEYDELSTATFSIISDSTGKSINSYTNDFGEFETRVLPGNYYIRITHPNYNMVKIKSIDLKGGEKHMLHILISKKDDPNIPRSERTKSRKKKNK
jgi:hypothetical protein